MSRTTIPAVPPPLPHDALQDVRLALGSLEFAQQASDEASEYAASASVPPSLIEEEEDAANSLRTATAASRVGHAQEGGSRAHYPIARPSACYSLRIMPSNV